MWRWPRASASSTPSPIRTPTTSCWWMSIAVSGSRSSGSFRASVCPSRATTRSSRSRTGFRWRTAGAEVYLALPGGHREPEKRLRATDVSGLIARLIARDFGGDRGVAVRESTARARRELGVTGWTAWPTAERRGFAQLSLVAALIGDLETWPSAERRRLVRVFRAKGRGSERTYANLLDSHRWLRRSLEALVT